MELANPCTQWRRWGKCHYIGTGGGIASTVAKQEEFDVLQCYSKGDGYEALTTLAEGHRKYQWQWVHWNLWMGPCQGCEGCHRSRLVAASWGGSISLLKSGQLDVGAGTKRWGHDGALLTGLLQADLATAGELQVKEWKRGKWNELHRLVLWCTLRVSYTLVFPSCSAYPQTSQESKCQPTTFKLEGGIWHVVHSRHKIWFL